MGLLSRLRDRRVAARAAREQAALQDAQRSERLMADPDATPVLAVLAANGVTFASRAPIYRGQVISYRLRVIEQILTALSEPTDTEPVADRVLGVLAANGVTFASRTPIYRGQVIDFRQRVTDEILSALDQPAAPHAADSANQ
jgi:hypothetical protein